MEKYARVFKIINNTSEHLYCLPNSQELLDQMGFMIRSNSFVVKEYLIGDFLCYVNLEEMYLQFLNKKRKIKFKNAHKHNIEVIIFK